MTPYIAPFYPGFDQQLLRWVAQQPIAVFLHSNRLNTSEAAAEQWDVLAAIGTDARTLVAQAQGQALTQLSDFLQQYEGQWVFTSLGYDLKNEIERLYSQQPDHLEWPDLVAFAPVVVVGVRNANIEVWAETPLAAQHCLSAISQEVKADTKPSAPVRLHPRMTKADYCATVEQLRQHIIEGDLYEINFCQEFWGQAADLSPIHTFNRLQSIAQAPFSSFFRWHHHYLMSASPERFLRRTGQCLISQPIKGTRRRMNDPEADAQILRELANSPKDRAENVMIVDLVRNDLARCCQPGTVKVDELFGLYSFPMVHQMISTISGMLLPDRHLVDILRATFPMGSMTGAPKVMAMELAERYEQHRRGLYSGALGYVQPNGDFDFNVLIRSILYQQETGYVSCSVGGAIVFDSIPEQEYEECLVKLAAMQKALGE
jgi:para-aminobenzoate synthetase component I